MTLMAAAAAALPAEEAQARCVDSLRAMATDGSTCTAVKTEYSSDGASPVLAERGTTLTLTADQVLVLSDGRVSRTVRTDGAVITFMGDATIRQASSRLRNHTAIDSHLPGADLIFRGDLTVIGTINNSDGAHVGSEGRMTVHGDAIFDVTDEGVTSTTVNEGRSDDPGSSLIRFSNLSILSKDNALRAQGALGNGVIITGGEVSLRTTDDNGLGVAALEGGKIFINANGGDITADANAFVALETPGAIVETEGDRALGLVARTSAGDARVEMSGGKVVTGADGAAESAEGVFSFVTGGAGSASILFSGGVVETNGLDSDGLIADVSDGSILSSIDGDAAMVMTGGSVATTGDDSAGIVAQTDISIFSLSTGSARVTQSGGSITTSGGSESFVQGSYGALALAGGSGEAAFTQTGGSIVTTGADAHGAYVVSEFGAAMVNQGEDGRIEAKGANASGVYASAATTFDIDLAGAISGGSGAGAGVYSVGDSGTLDIAAAARLRADSGVAIIDGRGAIAITSQGAIIGDVRTNAGDDTFSLLGGSLEGAVDMGEGADKVTVAGPASLGASRFGGGTSTAPILIGMPIPRGEVAAAPLSNADTSIDVLTFSGGARSFDGASLTHWERVVLDDGVDFRLGGALLTGA
ncbi:MAG: hypothetical protein ACK5MQ_08120, partial [Pikeienuella sp.]